MRPSTDHELTDYRVAEWSPPHARASRVAISWDECAWGVHDLLAHVAMRPIVHSFRQQRQTVLGVHVMEIDLAVVV